MLIIPAIDIIDGKVVRLTEGEFENRTEYSNSPLEQALLFKKNQFSKIHIVDLKASLSENISTMKTLKEIQLKTELKIEFGGGIRNLEIAKKIKGIGVDELIIGSLSILNKTELKQIANSVGSESIIIAADVINESIFIKGWTKDTGINIFDHIKYCNSLGIQKFLCTDIEKDGKLEKPNFELYKQLKDKFPKLYFIASGGVSSIEDLRELEKIGIPAVVVGKAIYENRISIEELKSFGK